MRDKLRVGIFLFNEVEVLDFAGPYEVFSIASNGNEKLFEVLTIGETGEAISARNGLKVIPDSKISDQKEFDILIIPGGYGAEHIEIKNEFILGWIKTQEKKVKMLASICTGAFLLAESGVLDNKRATTHWMDLDRFEKDYPMIKVLRNTKFVDENNILTSGGISAGINMSFHIVEKLFGLDVVKATAKRMEYDL